MRRYTLAVLSLGVALLLANDAWALGVRVKRGGYRNTQGKTKKDDPREEERRNRELHNQHITQMPASFTVKPLDSNLIEKQVGELGLTDEQARRLGALKEKIRGEVDRLNEEQAEARKRFIEGLERDCSRLAQTLVRTMQACKEFDANGMLRNGIAEILRPDQLQKLAPEGVKQ